jgi:hypothetical protein
MSELNSSSGFDQSPLVPAGSFLLPAPRGRLGSIPSTDRVTFTARHEAAHIAAHYACGHPVERVTIDPAIAGPGAAGAVWSPHESLDSKKLHEFSDVGLHELTKPPRANIEGRPLSDATCVLLYGRLIAMLAGLEEDRLSGRPASLSRSDVRKAMFYAGCIAGTHEAVLALIDRARADAKRILIANKHLVEAVAAALLKEGTLDAEQIEAVILGRLDVRKQWTAMAAGAAQFMAMTNGGLKLLTV